MSQLTFQDRQFLDEVQQLTGKQYTRMRELLRHFLVKEPTGGTHAYSIHLHVLPLC